VAVTGDVLFDLPIYLMYLIEIVEVVSPTCQHIEGKGTQMSAYS
jgi:hypothetical protein